MEDNVRNIWLIIDPLIDPITKKKHKKNSSIFSQTSFLIFQHKKLNYQHFKIKKCSKHDGSKKINRMYFFPSCLSFFLVNSYSSFVFTVHMFLSFFVHVLCRCKSVRGASSSDVPVLVSVQWQPACFGRALLWHRFCKNKKKRERKEKRRNRDIKLQKEISLFFFFFFLVFKVFSV